MPNIDMTEVIKIAQKDEFWSVRGKAIQSYANLEQALVMLFSVVSNTTQDVAATILFKVSSSDARNKILEKLFRKKFGDKFNLFRNSLFSQLRPIDIERNEIVHWNAACQMGHDGTKPTAEIFLIPPAFAIADGFPRKKTEDLLAFDEKCAFYSRLVSMFSLIEGRPNDAHLTAEQRKPWNDIFAQPITYPPPEDHQLFPNPEALENHIQSFLV